MRYIGIDPGLSGGIATIDGSYAQAWPMPRTERDLLDLLQKLTLVNAENFTGLNPRAECFAMIERVGATPQMGVVSAFTFGKGYGALLMALTAAGIPFDQVAPVKWQNIMEVRTPKERRAELGHKDKNINKRRAQQLFPQLDVTHAIADALLLASYARRIRVELLPLDQRETQHGKARRIQTARGQGQEARQKAGTKSPAA